MAKEKKARSSGKPISRSGFAAATGGFKFLKGKKGGKSRLGGGGKVTSG